MPLQGRPECSSAPDYYGKLQSAFSKVGQSTHVEGMHVCAANGQPPIFVEIEALEVVSVPHRDCSGESETVSVGDVVVGTARQPFIDFITSPMINNGDVGGVLD